MENRAGGAFVELFAQDLQFGHDVSVVENPAARTARTAGRPSSIWPRRQRRGEQQFALKPGVTLRSSIWPRRQRRGELRGTPTPWPWSASSIWPRRQRRGEPRARWPRTRTGEFFNLATTSASWRTEHSALSVLLDTYLQFGHDVSVVENRDHDSARRHVRNSSIWPRRQRRGERGADLAGAYLAGALQFGHDVSVVENPGPGASPEAPCRIFNLATTSASWRTMAPMLLGRGAGFLQFGHDVSVVENRPTSTAKS